MILWRAVGVAALWAVAGRALAAAPPLSARMAANANPLQRAVWACEAGARALAVTQGKGRFFLASAGADGAAEPPLALTGARLTGTGLLSDDRGWSVIRYACALSPDLRQAKAFSFQVIGKQTAVRPSQAAVTASNKVWGSGRARTLSHGVPETDAIDFWAECAAEPGRVRVALSQTVPWLRAGTPVTVTLGDGGHSALYVAKGVLNEEVGAPMPEFTVLFDDPLFAWMAAGRTLLINVGGDVAYAVSLKGAAAPIRAFTDACHA